MEEMITEHAKAVRRAKHRKPWLQPNAESWCVAALLGLKCQPEVFRMYTDTTCMATESLLESDLMSTPCLLAVLQVCTPVGRQPRLR